MQQRSSKNNISQSILAFRTAPKKFGVRCFGVDPLRCTISVSVFRCCMYSFPYSRSKFTVGYRVSKLCTVLYCIAEYTIYYSKSTPKHRKHRTEKKTFGFGSVFSVHRKHRTETSVRCETLIRAAGCTDCGVKSTMRNDRCQCQPDPTAHFFRSSAISTLELQ